MGSGTASSWASLLTLRRTRATLRGPKGVSIALTVAILYGFIALLAGGMLEFFRTGATGTTVEVVTNSYSPAWWDYPGLLVVAPGGVLGLPFLATVSMIVVSAGVGVGMGAGLLVAVRIVRSWRSSRAAGASANALAGLTPAMVALLTLGACCSTTAAAAAGIGVVAVASGATLDLVLVNSWFLNLFQIVVLGLALLAQEELLTLYSGLLPVTPSGEDRAAPHAAPQIRRPRVPVLGLRILLTAAGTLWGLSVLLALADPPAQAPYGAYDLLELLQRGPPGIAAVIAGLFPGLFAAWALRPGQKPRTTIFRGLLLLAGATVVFGVPPPLTGWGVYGLGNEVLAAAGTPSSLGGVAFPAGDQLAFSILSAGMGLFALLMALVPRRMLRMLGGEDPPGGTGRSLWPGAPEGEGRGGTERRFARPPPSREPQ